MRFVLFLVSLCLLFLPIEAAQLESHKPALLLTDQRIKRLKRDRERQTQRWTNFESRVKNVTDSSERGFELALYYRITGDESSAAEADRWIRSHPCERRQAALVRNALEVAESATPVSPADCPQNGTGPLARMRDSVLESAANPDFELDRDRYLSLLRSTALNNADEVYAAVEILLALGRGRGNSIRQQDTQFFNSLPVQFLLSLKPAQVDHPDWKAHVAALALIALDPNSDSAQFLQGWAIEDRQMITTGPGVAYEFLWADPYLPGVGYQNLDPWWYDEENARLLARTQWSPDACAISITPGSVKSDQCPHAWQSQRMEFGHLSLIRMTEQCVEIPPRANNAAVMLWGMAPSGRLKTAEGGRSQSQQADRAGLWRLPSNVSGKICTVK